MKKAILILVIFLIVRSIASMGQSAFHPALQNGSVLVDGGFSLNIGSGSNIFSSLTEKSTMTKFELTPQLGFFVKDGIVLGASINYSTDIQKDDQIRFSQNVILIGPLVRVYSQHGWFLDGGFGVGKNTMRVSFSNQTSKEKINLKSWILGIGYAAFLNDHIALEPALLYQQQMSKMEGVSVNEGQVVLKLDFSIYLTKRVRVSGQ